MPLHWFKSENKDHYDYIAFNETCNKKSKFGKVDRFIDKYTLIIKEFTEAEMETIYNDLLCTIIHSEV